MATDLASFSLSLLAEYEALPKPAAMTWDAYYAQRLSEWLAENSTTEPSTPIGPPMADPPIIKTVTAFENDEFRVGSTLTIYPNAGVDEKGNLVDVISRSGFAIILKPPTHTIGGVGVLLGRTGFEPAAGPRMYYCALTGIKSTGKPLTDAEIQAGVLCRDPIAFTGSNLNDLLNRLSPLFDGASAAEPPGAIVCVLPALLDAWSRKGYPSR